MNLNELKAKYIQYLTEKGELDNEKLSKLTSGLTSVFFLGSDFTQFVKENLSFLGIKTTGKIPNSVSEILALAEEEENTYDVKEEEDKKEKTYSSETTFNKDYSKNYIKNNYDKEGKLTTQETSVYSATGAQKSEYNLEFGAEGDVKSETQIEYGAATNKEADLNIDYSEQGEKGDCWLLATLNSLGSTDSGKEIIKNAISKNEDGSYSINFKGVNTSIKITKEELEAAKQSGKYAKGDDDVTLFELGFESVIDKIQKGQIKINGNHPNLSIKEGDTNSPLSGGNLEDAIFLLTGKDVKSEFKKSGASTEEFDKILSSLKDNPDKYAALIGFGGGNDGLTLKDINGNVVCNIEAGSTHAFSIKSVDEEGVTLVNPWDSSKEYKISLADARKFGTAIQYYATDDSFQETDSFDSAKLDQMPTQSEGGTEAEPSETIDGISSTPQTENPDTGTAPINEPASETPTAPSGNSGNSGYSGPASYTPQQQEVQKDPNDIKNMSLRELQNKRTTTQGELDTEKEKYAAIMSGTDPDILALKEESEKQYDEFKKQLKEKNSELADDYDKAKTDVENKKAEIDDNEKAITETETALTDATTTRDNAVSRISSLEGLISTLESAISSGEGDKSTLQQKLANARAAKEDAEKQRDEAQKKIDELTPKLQDLKNQQTELQNALGPLEDIVKDLETQISALVGDGENSADSELATAYQNYKDAEKAYQNRKTEAAEGAKAAIATKQKELTEIDNQIAVRQASQDKMDFSPSKLSKTYTLNGKEYMSLLSQDELNSFLDSEWKNGNYNYNSNCLSMAQVYCKDLMSQLGLKGNYEDFINDDQTSVEQKAKESLDRGYPVVLHVSTKAGTRHFATAVGYRYDENGKISFLLADNVRGVGITGCGDGEYRHLITGYSTPYANQNYGYRCMIYG